MFQKNDSRRQLKDFRTFWLSHTAAGSAFGADPHPFRFRRFTHGVALYHRFSDWSVHRIF